MSYRAGRHEKFGISCHSGNAYICQWILLSDFEDEESTRVTLVCAGVPVPCLEFLALSTRENLTKELLIESVRHIRNGVQVQP
jgi:hypothetical protein